MIKYIGEKKIKEIKDIDEKVYEVEYEDGLKEVLSKLMYNSIVSEEVCDATKLREKRIFPVVQAILGVLRDWGIKLSELQYMSAVLNQSLQVNEKEALKELWLNWIPSLNTVDDVDLIAIDRVLKSIKIKLEDNTKK